MALETNWFTDLEALVAAVSQEALHQLFQGVSVDIKVDVVPIFEKIIATRSLDNALYLLQTRFGDPDHDGTEPQTAQDLHECMTGSDCISTHGMRAIKELYLGVLGAKRGVESLRPKKRARTASSSE